MIYTLLGYAPDADPTISGVITNCQGVVPSLKGFKGAPSPVSTPLATLAATCQGAALVTLNDLTTRIIAGAPTKLYEAGASTWSDVSRAAAYTISGTGRWRFAQTGNTTLTVNGADTMQASVSTGAFSDVATAPIASIVETVGAFVMVLNTSSASNGIQWAGINGYTSWASSIATQAGSTTLTSSPGPILAGRRFGTNIAVYKKDSMYLGVYTGPPNIWEFVQIPGTAGAMSQESVVNIGTPDNPKHIFMGSDDFYLYDGAKPIPIGSNRVKNTVFKAFLQSRYYACQAKHDKDNTNVYFYYPVADSTKPDHCVVYNYRTDKWGVDDRQIEAVCDYVSAGITYGGLGTLYATYADLPNSPYDSAFLNASKPQPAIFDTNHIFKTLTGPAGNTSLTTGDVGDDIKVTTLNRVRPRFLTAPSSATWTPLYKMNESDSRSIDGSISLSSGKFDFMREARYHAGTLDMVGDWEMGAISLEGTEGSLE